MIGGGAGYEAARQEADCLNPGPCPDGGCDRWNDFFPATSCDELELSMLMPSCWDGVNLDSADHRSHMAYTKNGEAVRRGVPGISLILHLTPRLRGDTPSPRRRLNA